MLIWYSSSSFTISFFCRILEHYVHSKRQKYVQHKVDRRVLSCLHGITKNFLFVYLTSKIIIIRGHPFKTSTIFWGGVKTVFITMWQLPKLGRKVSKNTKELSLSLMNGPFAGCCLQVATCSISLGHENVIFGPLNDLKLAPCLIDQARSTPLKWALTLS